MQQKKKMALSTQIFIALVVAIIAGIAFTGNPALATRYIKPFGTIFLNLIKWIVCPLVFFSIMAGVVSLRDIKKVGTIGGRTVHHGLCRCHRPALCQSAQGHLPGIVHHRPEL